jgi:hypothetical protein
MRDDPERKRKPQSGARAVVVENSEYGKAAELRQRTG